MKKYPFSLVKWYLDCVTESGQVLIGYAATLRWQAVVQRYSSTLVCPRKQVPKTSTTLSYEAPTLLEEGINWNAPILDVQGTWLPLARPIERSLLQTPRGGIVWSCLLPRAQSTITHSGQRLEGLGYVERLSLTIAPWDLPFKVLRWGRFLSRQHTLVWIDWRGAEPFSFVSYDGKDCHHVDVTDKQLFLKDEKTALLFSDQQVLREGPLVNTVLSSIPGLARIVPAKILQTQERKWCSQACLESPIGSETGWAIHEVVSFI